MNAFRTIAAAALALAMASCSVKEDRTPCPCWLGIHITPSLEHSRDLTVSAWDQDRIFSRTVAVADYPNSYEQTVPKGHVTVAAYCGRRTAVEEGGRGDHGPQEQLLRNPHVRAFHRWRGLPET